MASELRRAAKALVESHPHAIPSEYPPDEAAMRLASRLADGSLGDGYSGEATPERVVIRQRNGELFYEGSWKSGDTGPLLAGEFPTPLGTQRFLKMFAIALSILLAATAWAFLGDETPVKVSAGLFTLFVILAFPYVVAGLSSHRSGREAALARAIQRALARPAR